MKLGVCYYPEHWPEARWAEDARQMARAGLSLVRIGEFAWSRMEPREGQYEWGWLDRAIETLAAEGLKIVLGTPTASPPAWMVQGDPAMLPVDAQGRRRSFGGRKHYCPNSPAYREHARRIARALGERYGKHPALAAWQIDNEFGARCFCEHCARAFREWLRGKYGTLEALNEAWGTVFWSEEYGDWAQIAPPLKMGLFSDPNPSLLLDYFRFASDSIAAFQQIQADELRLHSAQPVTTNFMGAFADLDAHALAHPLDFASWDSYPTGHLDSMGADLYAPWETRPSLSYDLGDPYVTGFGHDLTRGHKQAPFWVMEQQAGDINWGAYNPGVRPGAVRLWTWHAAAAGAEAVLYFRWRASRFAQEQYHSGLLKHDAAHNLGYREVEALQTEMRELDGFAVDPFQASAAILVDYNDLWALAIQPHRKDFSYWRHIFVYYRAFQRLGIGVDLVPPEADLSGYRIVAAPSLHIGTSEKAEKLADYARAGGTLLLGVRSGFKTPTNLVTDEPLPSAYRSLAGVEVTAWHALPPGAGYAVQSGIAGVEGQAGVWAEALSPHPGEAAAMAQYSGGPFAGQAALARRKLGSGQVYTAGWYPSVQQARALVMHLAQQAGLPTSDLHEGVIAIRRGHQSLLLNFTDEVHMVEYMGQPVSISPRDVRMVARAAHKAKAGA